MAPYYAEDGSLMVWTGTGYHKIPKVAAGDVGTVTSRDEIWSQGDSPYLIQEKQDLYGINDPTKYGLPNDSFDQFALKGDNTQDAFNYWLKSGDKEGSSITFKRDGDYYVPTYEGAEYWDTNQSKQNMGLGMVAGGALLGGLASLYAPGASSFAAGTGALTGSVDAALYGGLGAGAGAAGAAGAAAGAMNPYDAALMAGGEPIAGSGFSGASSGTTAFGQPFTTGATLSGAGEAAGSLFGLPNMQGVPGAIAGGAFAGVNPADLSAPTLGGGGGSYTVPPTSGTTPPFEEGFTPSEANPVSGAPSSGLPSWMTPDLMKLLAGVIGAGLGGAGGGSESSPKPPPVAVNKPTMYGGGQAQQQNWGLLGPTETERRMRQQYLPGLLGQQGPWSA